MKVTDSIQSIRTYRWARPDETWGLVPTMGYLHDGHLSLVRRARQENDSVGVSIFVNPLQFNDATDLDKYPRDMVRDLSLLEAEGVEAVWTPPPEIMYPAGFQTYVDVEQVTQGLEGAARPGHFRGVATVVAKLFNVFHPTRAYFGQKDAQQVAVIRRMVKDLNMPLNIVVGAIVRERDGLALSSRNVNLSPEARAQATCLYKALSMADMALNQGQRDADALRAKMTDIISDYDLARIDYVSVAHPDSLVELTHVEDRALLSLAVFVGGIRLIDNMIFEG